MDNEAWFAAAESGDMRYITKNYVKCSTSTEKKFPFQTALMKAAANRQIGVIKLLLSYERRLTTVHGWTALMSAAEKNYTDVIDMLLPYEAGIRTTKPLGAYRMGTTALIIAATNAFDSAVSMLYTGEKDASNWNEFTMAAYFLDYSRIDQSPYHKNDVDNYGRTPLMYAVMHTRESELRHNLGRCIKRLARHQDGMQDYYGRTALMYAVLAGNIDAIRYLLITTSAEVGKHITPLDREGKQEAVGKTALMLAAEKGSYEICDILSRHEIGLTTSSGITALMLAAREGHEEVCKLLAPYESKFAVLVGSDAFPKGSTALSLAMKYGHTNLVTILSSFESSPAIDPRNTEQSINPSLIYPSFYTNPDPSTLSPGTLLSMPTTDFTQPLTSMTDPTSQPTFGSTSALRSSLRSSLHMQPSPTREGVLEDDIPRLSSARESLVSSLASDPLTFSNKDQKRSRLGSQAATTSSLINEHRSELDPSTTNVVSTILSPEASSHLGLQRSVPSNSEAHSSSINTVSPFIPLAPNSDLIKENGLLRQRITEVQQELELVRRNTHSPESIQKELAMAKEIIIDDAETIKELRSENARLVEQLSGLTQTSQTSVSSPIQKSQSQHVDEKLTMANELIEQLQSTLKETYSTTMRAVGDCTDEVSVMLNSHQAVVESLQMQLKLRLEACEEKLTRLTSSLPRRRVDNTTDLALQDLSSTSMLAARDKALRSNGASISADGNATQTSDQDSVSISVAESRILLDRLRDFKQENDELKRRLSSALTSVGIEMAGDKGMERAMQTLPVPSTEAIELLASADAIPAKADVFILSKLDETNDRLSSIERMLAIFRQQATSAHIPEGLTKTLSALEEEIGVLKSTLRGESSLQDTMRKSMSVSGGADEILEEIDRHSRETRIFDEKFAQLREHVLSYKERFRTEKARTAELANEVSRLQVELELTQVQLANARADQQALARARDETIAQADELLIRKNDEILELQKALRNAENTSHENSQLFTAKSLLENRVETLQGEVRTLSSEVAARDMRLEEQQARLNLLEASLQAASNNAQESDERRAELELSLNAADARIEALQGELNTLQGAMDNMQQALTGAERELRLAKEHGDNEANALREQLASTIQALDALQQNTQKSVEELQAELAVARKQADEAEHLKDISRQTIAEARKHLAIADSRLQSLGNEL
ncbi:Ankyrin repeat protein 1 [Giardia muris]|uniref:Ankyrin repeat protein 1 n=1 Tax=Giardia muris TaxID=5742 RepID=A0A4Z1SXU6_GIAMU|nr:Ankyrin repeat protein 1 [Giardia muris]|eukprot:TNJ30516.1 Ankyrin repeat protein 1 [Giardia muris]